MSGSRVVVIPCSGVGKPYGTVSREAAFEVVEELRPESAEIVPLSLLVLGDEAARAGVAEAPVISIDGCSLACASKMVAESGGVVAREFRVMEFYREHRDLKPQGIAELNGAGRELARMLAETIAAEVDLLLPTDTVPAQPGKEAPDA